MKAGVIARQFSASLHDAVTDAIAGGGVVVRGAAGCVRLTTWAGTSAPGSWEFVPLRWYHTAPEGVVGWLKSTNGGSSFSLAVYSDASSCQAVERTT